MHKFFNMINKFFNWIDEKKGKLSLNSFLLEYKEGYVTPEGEEKPQSLIYSEVVRVGIDKRLINKWDYDISSDVSDTYVLLKDIKGKKYSMTNEEFRCFKDGLNRIHEKQDVFISFLYLPNEIPKKPKVFSFRLYIHLLDYQPSKNKY